MNGESLFDAVYQSINFCIIGHQSLVSIPLVLNESSHIIFKALEDNSGVHFSSGSFFAFLQQKGKQREQWVPKLQKNDDDI